MAKQQLIINDFSGGLNTKVAPHLIADNQCADMENVTTETGILEPIKGHTSKSAVGTDHFALMSRENSPVYPAVIPLNEAVDYVQDNSRMYITDTAAQLSGSYVTLWYENVSNPLTSTTNLSTAAPHTLTNTAILSWPGLNIDPYTIQYAVTAYDTDRGVESAPDYVQVSVPANSLILGGTSGASPDGIGTGITGSGIILSCQLNSPNTEADKLKFYRLGKLRYDGAELTEYRYVGEMDAAPAIGAIAYFYDGTPGESAGEILSTANIDATFNASANYRCIEKYKGKLFVSNYYFPKLYFSGATLSAFEIDNYLELTAPITALGSTINGLYIFTSDGKLSFLTGSSALDFQITELGYNTDCLHHSTLAKGKGFIMWLSKHGIMMASGYSVQNLSGNTFIDLPDAPILGDGAWENYCGAIVNESYYFMMEPNVLYKYDIAQKALSKMSISGLTQVFPYNNRLYGNISNTYYEMFNTNPTNSWSWTSKEYGGQSYDSEIEFESYKIAYIGTPTVKVYVDGVLELTQVHTTKASRGTEKILLPTAGNKGNIIQFVVTGDSSTKVYSIRSIYSYINLEN